MQHSCRGSCGSLLRGCRLSKRYPSINSLAVHCCTSRACRDAHCTIFGSPVCRRPLLSRCPTSRDFVPWRFLDAGQLSARVFHCCRRPKTSTGRDIPYPVSITQPLRSTAGLCRQFTPAIKKGWVGRRSRRGRGLRWWRHGSPLTPGLRLGDSVI